MFLASKCTHILIIQYFLEFLESRYRDSNSYYHLLVDHWGGFKPDGSMGPFLHVLGFSCACMGSSRCFPFHAHIKTPGVREWTVYNVLILTDGNLVCDHTVVCHYFFFTIPSLWKHSLGSTERQQKSTIKKRKAIYKSLVSLAVKTVNSVLVSLFTPQSFWFLCDHLSECCHDGGDVLQRHGQSESSVIPYSYTFCR